MNLGRNVALERFELSIKTASLSLVHEWIYWTLRSIASPVFSEFVIWVLDSPRTHSRRMINRNNWKVVDASLEVLAKRNPGFRVVIMASDDRLSVADCLPLTASNGSIVFSSPVVENRFSKLGVR